MLVLSRKKGESIVIDGNVEVTVLGTEGDVVKLGIKAPKEITIFRKEIYEQIKASNAESIPNMDTNVLKRIFKLKS